MNSTSGLQEVPAPGAPAPLRHCSGPAMKRSVLFLLMAHAFLLAALLLFYLRVVPLFLDLFAGQRDFSSKTNLVISLSIFLRTNWLFIPPIAIALIYFDALLYLALHRRRGPRLAALWSRAASWGALALILLSLWALCSPLFRMGPLINPPH